MRFEPGPGMGGHCVSVDPFYLTRRAREFHFSTGFIELVGKVNQQMPYHCVARIEQAVNDHAKVVADRRRRPSGANSSTISAGAHYLFVSQSTSCRLATLVQQARQKLCLAPGAGSASFRMSARR
jgi:hypothetical protein